jgi:CRISPR-associated exonuclease Cas4
MEDRWLEELSFQDQEEEKVVLVSAISQYAYCPRRCMLIHLESEFEDNVFTVQGRLLHENIDEPKVVNRQGVHIEYGLPIWSRKFGLVGKTDVVEFADDGTVRPVEYKRGIRRPQRPDDLQLCAQAMCLEEMLNLTITEGSIYYNKSRSRRVVSFTDVMRKEVEQVIQHIRLLMESEILPPPVADARCKHCSLVDICIPHALRSQENTKIYKNLFVPIQEEEIS